MALISGHEGGERASGGGIEGDTRKAELCAELEQEREVEIVDDEGGWWMSDGVGGGGGDEGLEELLELGEQAEEGMAELDHAAGTRRAARGALVSDLDNADVEPLVAEDRCEVSDKEGMVVLRRHKCDHKVVISRELEAEVHHGVHVSLGGQRDGHRMMPTPTTTTTTTTTTSFGGGCIERHHIFSS